MKLLFLFGLNGAREELTWWLPLDQFPTNIEYKSEKFEWVMYDADMTGQYDYILTFSKILPYQTSYNYPCDRFEDLVKHTYGAKCECGAKYTSFSAFHMRFCPKWLPWNKLQGLKIYENIY